MTSDEPSLTAEQEATNDLEMLHEENDNNEDGFLEFSNEFMNIEDTKKPTHINITLFNIDTIFLLFKTDVTSSFSILNNFKSIRFNNKPAGLSLKYKYFNNNQKIFCLYSTFFKFLLR